MKEGEGKKTQKRQGQNVIELVSEYEKEKKRTRESAEDNFRHVFGGLLHRSSFAAYSED